VKVTKRWFDEHPEFNNSFWARAQWNCVSEQTVFDIPVYYHGESLWFNGDEAVDTFEVWPHWNGQTVCTVEERIKDATVISDDSDCEGLEVQIGDDPIECTIVNTRVYEGIPTLSQYGLALMALLMLGVGLVGFRRFV
jgi:hypothetical protein